MAPPFLSLLCLPKDHFGLATNLPRCSYTMDQSCGWRDMPCHGLGAPVVWWFSSHCPHRKGEATPSWPRVLRCDPRGCSLSVDRGASISSPPIPTTAGRFPVASDPD